MTLPTQSFDAKPVWAPGRVWYFIAPVFFIAGVAAMVFLLFQELGRISSELVQVVVPGQAELTLDEAGSYTIFHEYRSVIGNRLFAVNSVSGLTVSVRAPGGEELRLEPAKANSTYNFGGRSGRSILTFTITAPGRYVLAAAYRDGRTEPQTVLAVGHGFIGSIVFTVLSGLAALFSGIAVTVGIIIFVAIRRHRVKRAGVPI